MAFIILSEEKRMNKKRTFNKLSAMILMLALLCGVAAGTTVFINEIHYDNDGLDTGEAIEIAGPAGTDLSGWSLVLYNGNDGETYETTIHLNGIISNQQGDFGTLKFLKASIQNGAPDGIALVNSDTVIQFLSYEGTITATNGPAVGMTSEDIGVFESDTTLSDSTPIGHSLQLTGTGSTYDDFTWSAPAANTFGYVNAGQTFVASESIPEFPTLALPMVAVMGLMFMFQRKRDK
jgi:hypothetical protein